MTVFSMGVRGVLIELGRVSLGTNLLMVNSISHCECNEGISSVVQKQSTTFLLYRNIVKMEPWADAITLSAYAGILLCLCPFSRMYIILP